MPDPVLLIATRRPRPEHGVTETEPVLVCVNEPNGTIEVLLDDGESFEFDAGELRAAVKSTLGSR